MRAINIFFFLSLILLQGCTTIEVAKEVTKATNSVKKSIENILVLCFGIDREDFIYKCSPYHPELVGKKSVSNSVPSLKGRPDIISPPRGHGRDKCHFWILFHFL